MAFAQTSNGSPSGQIIFMTEHDKNTVSDQHDPQDDPAPSPGGKGSKKARRTAARMAAVQAVYQMYANDQPFKAVIEEYLSFRNGKPVDGIDMVPPDASLFRDIVQGVGSRRDDLESFVSAALKKQKRFEAIADDDTKKAAAEPLLQAIMLCGAYELFAHHDIDAPIIISDYLNVTHAFYEQGEDRLINGVLDTVCKAVRDL